MRLVFGPRLAQWAMERIPHMRGGSGFGPCQCIGFADDTGIKAVGVFHWFREKDADVELSLAADTPKWATRGNFRALMHYAFIQLGCRRISAHTARGNKRVRKFLEGTGFVQEGRLRFALNRREHVICYGMLREECRWLGKENEQRHTISARCA